MTKVVITADAACDLPLTILKKYNVETLKCTIRTRTGDFLENGEVTAENLLEYIKKYKEPPKLLPVTVEEYRSFFEKKLREANSVCHISAGSKVTPFAYANALEASKSLKNVYVIDSKQISAGMAFAIIEASRLASDGFDAPFIFSSLENLGNKVHTCFSAKSFEFVKLVNALSTPVCDFFDLLSLSPFFYVANSAVKRTVLFPKTKGYIERMIKKELSVDGIDTKLLFVSCLNPMGDDADMIRAEIEKYARFEEIIFCRPPIKTVGTLGDTTVGIHYIML